MEISLTPVEARVLGCLIEKESTTPDQYPLTLNALTNACNQKSSRDPVMSLDDATVQQAIDSLVVKTLVSTRGGGSSRVSKFSHRMHDRLFDENSFSRAELSILALLFLRGPQTLGEIRTRSARLHTFSDIAELDAAMRGLATRDDGPFVVRLAVQPGRKEARYMHLFCGEPDAADLQPASDGVQGTAVVDDTSVRIQTLEIKVTQLTNDFAELNEKFANFVRQFD